MPKTLVPPRFSYYSNDAGYTIYDGEIPLGPEAVCRMLEKRETRIGELENKLGLMVAERDALASEIMGLIGQHDASDGGPALAKPPK